MSEHEKSGQEQQETARQIAASVGSMLDGFAGFEELVLTIIDAVPALISYVGTDCRYRLNNRAYELWFEHGRGEITGRHMKDVLGDAAWSVVGPKVEAALAGQTVHYEAQVPYRDAGLRWVDATYVPSRGARGEVVGVVVLVNDISERKEAEEKLRLANERFELAARATRDGIWDYDPATQDNVWSPRCFELLGLPAPADPQRITQAWLNGRMHPDDCAPMWAAAQAYWSGQVPHYVTEMRLRHEDGSWRWFLSRGVAVQDDQGRVVRMTGALSDDHDRRVAEQALRASEERFRTAVEATSEIVWTNDAHGKMVGPQPGWGGFTGQSLQDYQGYGWSAAVHPEDAQPTIDAWERAVAERRRFEFEHRVRRWDGTYRLCSIRAVPVLDGSGPIRGWVGVHTDITERSESERQLRHGQEQLDFALAAADLGQWSLDLADHTAHRTLRHDQIFGYDALLPEWTYEMFLQHVVPDDRAAVDAAFQEAVATGSAWAVECRIRRADGAERTIWTKALIKRDAGGQVERMLGIVADITDRKRLESELRQSASSLSEAHRRKDEFLATLAHELRNPLAPIRNGLQIMRLSTGSQETVEQVRTMMERQIEQMVRLVDDLLDVSRITRDKLELRKEPVELARVLNIAVETSRPLIDANGHELTLRVPTAPIVVDGDATRLGQVFANLLINAAKFSERGGRIGLAAERQGADVVVVVKDTGIGIPAGMLPRIFEMFTQVDQSLERSRGGLGIGLTLVKRLVDMHGGSVEARSEGLGKGSEFVVRLPVAVSPLQAMQPTGKAGEAGGEAGQRRILVADDNIDSAASLAMVLEIMGNDVRTASDGLQAVEVAAAFRPAVILLDIGMPKLNGYEACRRIREQPWGKKAILVALTGWGQDEDRKRSGQAGFDHHLVKPVDPSALDRLLASSDGGP